MVQALIGRAHPQTYNQIFDGMEHDQEVLVPGEEDDAYAP